MFRNDDEMYAWGTSIDTAFLDLHRKYGNFRYQSEFTVALDAMDESHFGASFEVIKNYISWVFDTIGG